MSLQPLYDVVTAPEDAEVFFDVPSEYLRLDPDQELSTVWKLMSAAVDFGELYTNRVFRKTEFTGNFSCLEYDTSTPRGRDGFVTIQRSPLGAVTSLEVDLEGETSPTSLAIDVARMPNFSRVFMPKGFTGIFDEDSHYPIRVTFEAGYVNSSPTAPDIKLPSSIQQGIDQHVAYLFENRGDVAGDFKTGVPDDALRSYDTVRIYSGYA